MLSVLFWDNSIVSNRWFSCMIIAFFWIFSSKSAVFLRKESGHGHDLQQWNCIFRQEIENCLFVKIVCVGVVSSDIIIM